MLAQQKSCFPLSFTHAPTLSPFHPHCLAFVHHKMFLPARAFVHRLHQVAGIFTSFSHRPPTIISHLRHLRTSQWLASKSDVKKGQDQIAVHFVVKGGERLTRYGFEGENVMALAQRNDIDIEGACEASLACCTCHVYVKDFQKLNPATEEEEDLLDMAPFLQPNSRLSCQIILSKELDGLEVTLPPVTRNFYVDGKKPSHH